MHPKRGLLPFQEKIEIPIEGGSIINCRRFARTAGALTLAAALCLTGTACAPAQTPETTAAPTQAPTQATTQPATEAVEQVEKSAASHGTGALPVKALTPKAVDVNPYMASVDPNIHGDGYNTDSTDEIMPWAFIRRSTCPTRPPTPTPLRRSFSTTTTTAWCRCWAASPSGILMPRRRRLWAISPPQEA